MLKFKNKNEAIWYLCEKISKFVKISSKEEDDEYFNTLMDYYGDKEIIDYIKMGEDVAKNQMNSEIKTERSDSSNILIRYIEDNKRIAVLGVISKKGKVLKADINSMKSWINRLVQKLKEGYVLYTSANKFSKLLLNRVINIAKKEGVDLKKQTHGSVNFKGINWDNIIISKLI